MQTIESLPPEIMHLILRPAHFGLVPWRMSSLNSKKEYIGLRLVSQTFYAIITPLIFRDLIIRSTECNLQRLETIAECEHLKNLVKTYTYVLSKSRAPTRTAYDEYLRLAADPSGLSIPDVIHSSGDPAALELPIWINQREFELSNDLHELHVKHLANLPNLMSISIEAPRWCSLSDMPHNMDTCLGGRQWGPIAFRAVLLAMYRRTLTPDTVPVQNLAIEGISEECMLLPPSFISKAIDGMRGIKHLKFSIRTLRDTSENTTPGWILLIGRLIQSITSLESLEIEVQESVTEIHFRSLITPCKSKFATKPKISSPAVHWPNLKRLILNDLIFIESHILNFITAHRKTLNSITFSNCHLQPDPSTSKDDPDVIGLDPPVRVNPWLAVFRAIHTHFTPKSASGLSLFQVEDLWFDQPKQKRMHDCETSRWTEYISGTLNTEPSANASGSLDCPDCQDEEGSDEYDGSTDESEDAYFFGGPGFGFGLWDDEDDDFEEDEDMDSDDPDDDLGAMGGMGTMGGMGVGPSPHLFLGGFEF